MTRVSTYLHEPWRTGMTPMSEMPASWKPQPGETLAGFVIDRVERESEYQYGDEDHPMIQVLVVDSGDSTTAVWCSTKQLRDFVEKDDPRSGDWVEITYEGTKRVHGGRLMKTYTASIERD